MRKSTDKPRVTGPNALLADQSSARLPAPRHPHPGETCWPDRGSALAAWDHLALARATYDPRILAEAEDSVFLFYRPLADALAREGGRSDRVLELRRARAEVGLAKAILAWTLRDEARFEEYARRAIQSELQHSLDEPCPRNALAIRCGLRPRR